MKTLNLLLMSGAAAVLASSFALTGPVAAQSADSSAVDTNAVVSDHGNWTLKEREDWLDNRLHMARDDGSIDHTEFDRVRNDLDGIRDDEHHLRSGHQDGQLTDNETATLETQLDDVASRIHWLHEDKFQRPW
jgi:hypothetical protein